MVILKHCTDKGIKYGFLRSTGLVGDVKNLGFNISVLIWRTSVRLKKTVFLSLVLRMFIDISCNMRFPTMWYVWPANAQTSLRIRAVWPEPLLVTWIFYDHKATDRTSFGVSKLKGGWTGLTESTLVKLLNCLNSRFASQIIIIFP